MFYVVSVRYIYIYSNVWFQCKTCECLVSFNYPCVRDTLASGLKLALVYKQISQVGLTYHPGQLYQLC